ncbi:MAG TPA: glutathione S-transferase family protein [Dongiaceae bacterium]|nr:glutathione S-transferase family protein [Dongiaceae bacterium]
MYKLYGVKKWGSLGPQCILEEVGAPYEMVWLSAEDRRGPYRKVNPLGYVPSLQLADGRFVFESSAIVTHITDAHPSALAPRPGTPDHALYLSWLTWINAEIYSTMNAAEFLENEDNTIGDAACRAALAQAVWNKVDGLFDVVERHLGQSGGFMLGRSASAADLYLMMVTLWTRPNRRALYERCPNIGRVVAAVNARPAVAKVLALNELA